MTQTHQIKADVRRHFVITGTYKAEDHVSSAQLQGAVERALMGAFAEPIQIAAYGTPKYHHPYAVDVREQVLKLTPEEFERLTNEFPHLMVALMTFFRGAFEPEEPSVAGAVYDPPRREIDRALDIVSEVERERP